MKKTNGEGRALERERRGREKRERKERRAKSSFFCSEIFFRLLLLFFFFFHFFGLVHLNGHHSRRALFSLSVVERPAIRDEAVLLLWRPELRRGENRPAAGIAARGRKRKPQRARMEDEAPAVRRAAASPLEASVPA